jgi:hypothetical protein
MERGLKLNSKIRKFTVIHPLTLKKCTDFFQVSFSLFIYILLRNQNIGKLLKKIMKNDGRS